MFYDLLDIVYDNLFIHLDAGNPISYPGSGNTWYDLSGNCNNFNVLSTAWNSNGYFVFNGNYGYAKKSSDINLSGDVTYCVLTLPLNNTSNWRTLTRSYNADHQVIINQGAWDIGTYDNDVAGFLAQDIHNNLYQDIQHKLLIY